MNGCGYINHRPAEIVGPLFLVQGQGQDESRVEAVEMSGNFLQFPKLRVQEGKSMEILQVDFYKI